MKRIITITLVILNSIAASAQTIEVGLNAGVMSYLSFNDPPPHTEVRPYLGVRGSINSRGWQVGLGVEHFRLEAISALYNRATDHEYSSYSLGLFGNKLFRLPKGYVYTGINGGYISGTSKQEALSYFPNSGYNFGIQGGYTQDIAKGFGINIEAAAKCNLMYYRARDIAKLYFTFPVSLGVRYTF